MRTLAAVAMIPLLAGLVAAQQSDQTTTTTTTTKASDESIDQTRAIHTEAQCPVTTNTTSFGLLTPEGKYIRFDQPSNKRIVEMVKNSKHYTWNGTLLDAGCYAAHTERKETSTTATLGEKH